MGADNESKTAIALVDPLVGSIFDKRFRVEERIAAGGFGAIYRATHVKSGHPIALKILLPALAQDLGILARFRREGDTLTSLRNPHTITAYELGQAADRTLFIVMELLHGKTLFERYEETGPLEWRRMAKIARQVCESLDEAHARGIVHRDLKPTNIHLEEVDGDPDFVKVLDFGIAKILQGSDFDASDITNAGTMIGTIDYMSPEQMVGGQVSGQTDIYTLGIVMYEMIAGVRPFPEAKSAASALAAMLKTTPEALFLRAPVPEQISKIVMRCLERETNRRYRSVAELMKDLDEVLGAGGSSSVVLDATKTFELDAAERSAERAAKARSDDEATTFTPPPEKLLQELRTPKVERVPEWDDDDENATTAAERMDLRAASRAETNIADGIDPHGPTVAARPIRDSDANAMIRREEAYSAKTPTVRRDLDALRRDIDALAQARPPTRLDSDGLDPKTPPFQRADSDGLDPRTPPFQRVDKHEAETAPRSRSELDDLGEAKTQRAGFESDSQSRGKAGRSSARGGFDADSQARGKGNPERSVGGSFDADSQSRGKGNPERSVRGTIEAEAPRPKSPTRQPTPNPDAGPRPKSLTRPPQTPDPDAPRPKSGTRPPPTPDPDGPRAKTVSAPPPMPPARPLAARNFPTPVPQVVVAPFSSTPRAPTGMPTPPPGSLPPGVPMPPGRPTPMPGSLPPGVPAPPSRVLTPPGTPQYPGSGPIPNPFAPSQAPSSNPSGNPFAPSQAPSSNPSGNPFAPNTAPSSNPAGSPFTVPGSNPSANPFAVPGSNPSANPFGVPGSNPSANPFGVPGSNPSANPFPSPGIPSTPYVGGQSNPFLSTSPAPIPPSVQRGQYDIHGMAARETMIRRLVWIVALVLAAGIGIVLAMR